MVQLTCTMIQLGNVSQTVQGPLVTAEALVVLATIHSMVYRKMKGYLCQGLWRIDTVAVPFIHPHIMVKVSRETAKPIKPE